MKLRPTWSKISGSTTSWLRRGGLFLAAIALGGCSSLDPSVGTLRGPVSDPKDAAVTDGQPPGECTQVAPGEVCFARDIRPILRRTRDEAMMMMRGRGCYPCHDGNASSHVGTSLSGLDLSSLGELRKGGGSTGTRIIVAGKPEESLLIRAMRGQFGSNRMPKGGPFHEDSSEEMQLLTRWILEGAKGADDE